MASLESSPSMTEARTSNYVYIRSEEYAWIPGRLLETNTDKKEAIVSVAHFADEQDIKSGVVRDIKKYDKVTVNLKDYENQALLLQNVNDQGTLIEVQDMVDLPFLHEAAILYNLKVRHQDSKPYTRTGDIVIACNPYQWFHNLYDETTRLHYAKALVWSRSTSSNNVDPRTHLEPHIYETSALAFRGLAMEGEDQSILVSGESGAGKTESVKICLHHIASVQRGINHPIDTNEGGAASSYESPIVKRVLDSNPLLEAFGNAKTVRNDNSSRFGKYITLQFDNEDPLQAAFANHAIPSCILAGSKCQVYLLEKSRVVLHEEEERTYHIFYQLLAAPEEVKIDIWEGLADTDNESFAYVGYTDTDTIEGKTDAERFLQTVESLALVGVKDDKLKTLMRTICVVLQLGNVVFEADANDDTKSIITSQDVIQGLAGLMGVSVEDLTAALTIRTILARNEEFKVPLRQEQAVDSCDAFAKEIYAKTFLWLVRAINDATCAELNYEGNKKTSKYGVIGLLDIFGFESFETNRFEQLCINYANEKLQQKFTQDIFRSVQQEYEEEGIELDEIRYDDNTDVLDLVEGRMGLLAVLNEECVRPGGSDKSFVSKIHAMNKENPIFLRENNWGIHQFGVKHYAGAVFYDADGFVTKNTDTLPKDFQDIAKKSSNAILANELENDSMINMKDAPKKKAVSSKAPKAAAMKKGSSLVGETVWTKFKNQLTVLMTNLGQTRTRYIRCIKPNTEKLPLVMEHISTIEQLRCAGVVAAVTISRSAFPNRLEHEIVQDRFKSLWKKGEHASSLERASSLNEEEHHRAVTTDLLASALEELEKEENGHKIRAFVIGKSRAYFRAGALEYLEALRLKGLGAWATEIQKITRAYQAFKRYRLMRYSFIKIQACTREKIARRRYRNLRFASIKVECWYRCLNASRTLVALRRKYRATRIQALWRMLGLRAMYRDQRLASIKIQAMVRGSLQRPKFRVALQEKREEAKLENQVIALQKKLEEAERRRVEAEKAAEERARRAIEEFREEKKEVETVVKEIVVVKEPSVAEDAVTRASSQQRQSVAGTASANESEQQQALMDESGKMLEYLRNEVFKLRKQNTQMRRDMDQLKDNNQRLMDANASAGASFAALNQHAKQLTRTNEKLTNDLTSYKQQVQKLSVIQVELKEELKMKQATYVAEIHSRLQYQKGLSKIVDMAQERCRDNRLVEDILRVADECEHDYMSGPTGLDRGGGIFSSPSRQTPKQKVQANTPNSGSKSSLMGSFRSLWS